LSFFCFLILYTIKHTGEAKKTTHNIYGNNTDPPD